jgi:glycosyltransferase involved in cell wall biosynthesis
MRIFIAVRHAQDPDAFHSTLWSRNFYPALRKLGHDLVESDVDLEPASRFMGVTGDYKPQEREMRGRLTQKIVDEVEEAHAHEPIDLFLSYFYNAHFEPSGFEAIHDLGIPTINFYCNSIYQFDLVDEVASAARWAWHAEKPAHEKYKETGANPVWVQMGANPDAYHPVEGIERKDTACFVGRHYADRDRLVAELVRAGVPVDVYGSGWTNSESSSGASEGKTGETYLGRRQYSEGSLAAYANVVRQNLKAYGLLGGVRRTYLQWKYRRRTKALDPLIEPVLQGYAQDLVETFNAYEVVLNFSNVWSDGRPGSELVPHVRMRDFEAPMCGACYLTGHTEEITEFYNIGEEIDTYRSAGELVNKTQYYLDHPGEADRLRRAAYERATRDHTWQERFKELFQKTGLSSAAR